jgi:hypothetical protein
MLVRSHEEAGAYWWLEPDHGSPGALQGTEAMGEVCLEIVRAGAVLFRAVGFEGTAAPGELPWTFGPLRAERGEGWRLAATGSWSSCEPEVLVAVPDAAAVEPGAEAVVEALDRLEVADRRLLRVRGEVTIPSGQGVVRIRTGAVEDDAVEVTLTGARLAGLEARETIWLGFPKVLRHLSSGARRAIPMEEMRFRDAGGWSRGMSATRLGRVAFRYLAGDEIRAAGSVLVAPPDLRYELVIGDREAPGRIRFSSTLIEDVGILPHPGLENLQQEKSRDKDGLELRVGSSGEPPSSLPLRLAFAGGGTLDVQVPFPHRLARFVQPDGTPLPVDRTLHISRIDALRDAGLHAGEHAAPGT